jgi:hypothetical protein
MRFPEITQALGAADDKMKEIYVKIFNSDSTARKITGEILARILFNFISFSLARAPKQGN